MNAVAPSPAVARKGLILAIVASFLFGLSLPFTKIYLTGIPPLEAAGLTYCACGLTLGVWLLIRRLFNGAGPPLGFTRRDMRYLAGSILFGGIVGPTLGIVGLARATGTVASLLYNLEPVLTVLFAVAIFGDRLGRRAAKGAFVVLSGSTLIAIDPGNLGNASWLGVVGICGSCAAWALDNNLMQRISGRDPATVIAIKSLAAGLIAIVLSIPFGAVVPDVTTLVAAALMGAIAYAASLMCFVFALRYLGAARTGAIFATAPFIAAVCSMAILRETVTVLTLGAGVILALGVYLLSTEQIAVPPLATPVSPGD